MSVINVEGKIAELLFKRVSTISGSIPTEYPNSGFTPPNDAPYLSVSHLPNGFAFEGLSSGRTYQGILQITLVEPTGRAGIKPQDDAGGIASHFSKNTKLFGSGVVVTITKNPKTGQSFPGDGETRTPITIEYQASEANA